MAPIGVNLHDGTCPGCVFSPFAGGAPMGSAQNPKFAHPHTAGIVLLTHLFDDWCYFLQFFSSSVTYPAMGMSRLLPECYGTIDNPGNVTNSPELV